MTPKCGNPGCSCMDLPGRGPRHPGPLVALALLAFLLLCLAAARAGAQEAMQGPSGAPGVWLPLELSRDVLGAYQEGPRLHERIRLLESSLELRAAAGLELRAALVSAESEAHTARAALSEAREARDGATRRARRRLGLAVSGTVLGALAGFLAGFLGR